MGKQRRSRTIGARQIGSSVGNSIATTLGASPQLARTVGKYTGHAAQYARNAFRTLTGFEKGGLTSYKEGIIVVDPRRKKDGTFTSRSYRNQKGNNPKMTVPQMRAKMVKYTDYMDAKLAKKNTHTRFDVVKKHKAKRSKHTRFA